MIILTVINPFGGYAQGDQITDPQKIAEVLASEYEGHVLKTNVPDSPPKQPAV